MSEIEFVDHSTVKLYKTNANDRDVALAARASLDVESYAAELDDERIRGLVNFLVKNRHTSPLEHGSFTFVVDTPLFVAREFMRHRTWSYNEVSARYSKMRHRVYLPDAESRPLQQVGKPGAYSFAPGNEEQQAAVFTSFQDAAAEAFDRYDYLLGQGVAKEVARDVLPVGMMTTFWATANPLNVLRFLKLRTAPDALYEIREVADQIAEHFEHTMPVTYDAYQKYGL